jgi:hypothetical protein
MSTRHWSIFSLAAGLLFATSCKKNEPKYLTEPNAIREQLSMASDADGVSVAHPKSIEADSASVRPSKPMGQDRMARLPFLADVLEFAELNLMITQQRLETLIVRQHLLVRVDQKADEKTFFISTKDGENVIVMFRHRKCSGIQRMLRNVPGPT